MLLNLVSIVVMCSLVNSLPIFKNEVESLPLDVVNLLQNAANSLSNSIISSKLVVQLHPTPSTSSSSSSSSSYTLFTALSSATSQSTKTSAASNNPNVVLKPRPGNVDSIIPPILTPFQIETLTQHNIARASHHASPLIWNNTLAEGAMRWVQNKKWHHSQGSLFPNTEPYGENLYATTLKYPSSSMTEAIKAFTDEESVYDYSNPGFSEATGHFTQVVWKGSKSGCAVASVDLDIFSKYTKTTSYFVCLYFPSGNYITQFADNVLPI